MTELDFLLDLLFDHKLQKPTKIAITNRIKEIQVQLNSHAPASLPRPSRSLPGMQAPSIVAKYPEMAESELVPVESIAQTAETVKAMAERQSLISNALNGKVEPGRTSPRKIGRQ